MAQFESNQIESTARERSGFRPEYIVLDEDSEEASHVYRTFDEAIFVIQNGKSVQRFSLDWRSVDDYVTSVRDDIEECDWEDQHYYADYEGPFEPRVRSITMEGAA